MFGMQEVAVNSYSCYEYAAVEHKRCCTTASNTSAVVFLYDSVDICNKDHEHFLTNMKHSYSVIIVTVIMKSASVDLCHFMNSVKQLADMLPNEVIANGVIVNVRGLFLIIMMNLWYIQCTFGGESSFIVLCPQLGNRPNMLQP